MKLSLVIPAYNEENNISILYDEIKHVLDNLQLYFRKLGCEHLSKKYKEYEIIFVDDGSTDKTFSNLIQISDKKLRIIKFRRNFGQSAALLAGFKLAQGDVIVTLDGDLQNDPKDIPRLLAKLEEGYDCVSGWRYKRKDNIIKHIMSRTSNFLRHILINDKVNDSGCTLKVYKKKCLEELELYGEMHRYIASLIKLKGFRIGELKVRHRQRIHGKTKYSMYKLVKGFLDLGNVWFWQKFSGRPLHLFGAAGISCISIGSAAGIYSVYLKIFNHTDLSNTFLPVLAAFFVMVGVQFFVSGILADILIKNYHRSNGSNSTYTIEKIVENN